MRGVLRQRVNVGELGGLLVRVTVVKCREEVLEFDLLADHQVADWHAHQHQPAVFRVRHEALAKVREMVEED